MAKIDIFLDFDEVFKGTIIVRHDMVGIVYDSSVKRLNRFIEFLKLDGHEITLVPVTTHRESKSAAELRTLFEDTGITKDLPFVHIPDGGRSDVVRDRVAEGVSDAYVIFDDDKSAYPDTQENLVVVTGRRFQDVKDELRGISMGNIDAARKMIREQLAAPARGLSHIPAANTDPSQML